MTVFAYQLLIFVSLAIVRVLWPKQLLLVALIWTGFTALNLFYPPLIVLQLAVIWGTFCLLNPRGKKAGPTNVE